MFFSCPLFRGTFFRNSPQQRSFRQLKSCPDIDSYKLGSTQKARRMRGSNWVKRVRRKMLSIVCPPSPKLATGYRSSILRPDNSVRTFSLRPTFFFFFFKRKTVVMREENHRCCFYCWWKVFHAERRKPWPAVSEKTSSLSLPFQPLFAGDDSVGRSNTLSARWRRFGGCHRTPTYPYPIQLFP